MKLKMLVLLVLMGPAIANSSALEKKKGDEVIAKPNLTPLMIAALSCDLNKVTSLLSDGADVKAIDARGNDALTYASTQRTKDMFLQCPDVVSTLTKAGADPWKANLYQSPEFQLHQPGQIAVLRAEDIREAKDDRSKGFAEGIEQALSQGRPRYTPVITPHYPVIKLSEAREKLKAGGFSDADVMHPDRRRACSVLGVDAVFEAVLKDYSHGLYAERDIASVEVGTTREASVEFWLTDCRTGDLLWTSNPTNVGVQRSFLATAFLSSYTTICEQVITFPRYKEAPK
jgi:hypothetical protein